MGGGREPSIMLIITALLIYNARRKQFCLRMIRRGARPLGEKPACRIEPARAAPPPESHTSLNRRTHARARAHTHTHTITHTHTHTHTHTQTHTRRRDVTPAASALSGEPVKCLSLGVSKSFCPRLPPLTNPRSLDRGAAFQGNQPNRFCVS